MKKYLSILLITVILLAASASTASAVGPGGACCPANFSYVNGRCLSNQMSSSCQNLTNKFCSINELVAPASGISHDFCINTGLSFCQNYLANNGSYSAQAYCNGLVGLLPLGPILGPVIVSACVPIYTDILNFNQNQNITQAIQCNRGLVCAPTSSTCVSPQDAEFIYQVCSNIPSDNQSALSACASCLTSDPYTNTSAGIWTAVGCINISPSGFIKSALTLALGLAGGLALLLMIYGAFMISISAGDPKKADEGRQIIGGAIGGLLIIIFSIVILRLIGVDILQIPGF